MQMSRVEFERLAGVKWECVESNIAAVKGSNSQRSKLAYIDKLFDANLKEGNYKMNGIGEFFSSLGGAALQLLAHPFYYIAIVLIMLQYRRQIYLERKLFHTKLHSLGSETGRAVLWGIIGGTAASLIMIMIGVSITPQTVYWIWGAVLLLVLFRMRFLCLAYAAGLIAILQYVSLYLNPAGWPEWLSTWAEPASASLQAVSISTLLVLVAVLHFVESFYVRYQGNRMLTPLFLEGKRGKIVGGYQLQGFWPVPLILPLATGGEAVSWTSIWTGDFWQMGWHLAALPVVVGFMDLTKIATPQQKLRQSSKRLLLYSAVVLGLAILVEWQASMALLAGLLCLLLHEAIISWSYRSEMKGTPLFVHPSNGLRVLGVIPGSPAEKLGVLPGEILTKVNDMKVLSKKELHSALRINPAYCKLEIIDKNGELRILKRAMFAGENYQLGILLAPDDEARYFMEFEQPKSVIAYARLKLAGLFTRESAFAKGQDQAGGISTESKS